jgi:large subunit ribosomal protein L28e
MSSNLLWELTKNHNAFLVKRNGVTLSSDPANNTGKNIRSHSGLLIELCIKKK